MDHMTYQVITQHGVDRKVRSIEFTDFDEAVEFARAITPQDDGSMCPNVDESYADHPGYEKGIFWNRNRYAAIIKEEAAA